MRNAKTLLSVLAFAALVSCILLIPNQGADVPAGSTAAVGDAKTIEQILQKRKNFADRAKSRSAERLVNVLIVPGHDDEHWGTSHGKLKEVELNRMLAESLYGYLVKEDGINVVLASDSLGYNKIFEEYFEREKDKVQKFIETTRLEFRQRVEANAVEIEEDNFHNVAPDTVVHKLYGINRWVNDADFDIVIHIHFNDYAKRNMSKPGKYTGFSIYAPGPEFENHELSRRLADAIFAEMKKIRPVSDLPAEEDGVIEDYELIAIGANASLEAGSVLVEYGYIYESIFTDPKLRSVALDNMAYATYAGIKNMLGETPASKETRNVVTTKNKTTAANLEWQFQKAHAGLYPEEGKTLRDCPLAGYFGECSARVK